MRYTLITLKDGVLSVTGYGVQHHRQYMAAALALLQAEGGGSVLLPAAR